MEILLNICISLVVFISTTLGEQCGRLTSAELRIIGGREAARNSWPWIVSFTTGPQLSIDRTKQSHECGGVLITNDWVLTAAHCLDNPNAPGTFPKRIPREWVITAGVHDRRPNASNMVNWQTSTVRRFIPHGKFKFSKQLMATVNDIAMIQLAQPFRINAFVKPICLPNRENLLRPGWGSCYTAGWGTTDERSDSFPFTLQEVQIPLINFYTCRKLYGNLFRPPFHFCGGDYFYGQKDSCRGDSGGPLACQSPDGTWHVAGIVSWGIGCGRPKRPGVYTNVATYQMFIARILLAYSPRGLRQYQPDLLNSIGGRSKRSTSFAERLLEINSLASSHDITF